MKKLLLLTFFAASQLLSAKAGHRINPIIGDQSFVLKYGYAPDENTPDQMRIAAHLEYAEYVLRSKDVSGIPVEQIQKRTHLLDLLHEYRARGVFPKNEDVVNERRPCFIDHDGTICAVGYLVEQTAGHEVAELISERFMYEEILDMNDPVVLNWIEECGLTREECAVIQPTYGFRKSKPRVVFSYGTGYRFGSQLYHSIRLMHESPTHYRKFYSDQNSAGIQFDWLYGSNYSIGLRYVRDLKNRSRRGWLANQYIQRTTVSIMPELFVCNGYPGMNLKPDIGITRAWDVVSLNLSYAYAIPLVNEEKYLPGRHEIALRLGIDLVAVKWPKFPKKTRTDSGNAQAFR